MNYHRGMLSQCQSEALVLLESEKNVFLTGVAGSGKSFLVRHFLDGKDPKEFPILASTGAAAILLGGRTFHSFFGLGIMEGGVPQTVDTAVRNSRVRARVRKARAVIVDEVSMLGGEALEAAEAVARFSRRAEEPWGGLRVIFVGDFAQLPPVHGPARGNGIGNVWERAAKPWAFQHEVWERSDLQAAVLRTVLRTQDEYFLKILNQVRIGVIDSEVVDFLSERRDSFSPDFSGTRLFARKDATERYNLERLEELSAPLEEFFTEYWGLERHVDTLKRQAPIGERLALREGALVMLRQNDPRGRWVNGSLGYYRGEDAEKRLRVELVSGGDARVEKTTFTLSDGNAEPLATARNYPLNLAWASTIHKAQGSTFDRMSVDLRNLWEPGHAYVALSRARSGASVFVEGWTENSFRVAQEVLRFHEAIGLA